MQMYSPEGIDGAGALLCTITATSMTPRGATEKKNTQAHGQ